MRPALAEIDESQTLSNTSSASVSRVRLVL
ncbi:hypothetical protein SAMN06295937_10305 [Sphingopyxis flava]|uniref:Uncharacterized protein n=1 Tax=Sphingopyxis flava TaxID=1507287 RepID=A0A1T5F828_9SPHN|nr:hypothetical protein SAMN06295937_10305 [Sphingopyxis flava]